MGAEDCPGLGVRVTVLGTCHLGSPARPPFSEIASLRAKTEAARAVGLGEQRRERLAVVLEERRLR